MDSAIRLSLMIGPVIAIPAPREVVDALLSVQVTTSAGRASVFQLTFTLSNKSPLHTLFLLTGGNIIPIIRVILIATINGSPEILIDGVMTHHEISPGTDPGHSRLTVTGDDLTRFMDYSDFSGFPFPAMPPEVRILIILAKYAFLGIIPFVTPSVLMDVPDPTRQIPAQKSTDLSYITHLAHRAGYVFYLEPGPEPGISVAYWGPEIKIGMPQPALNINMDAYTNVESLTFSFNSDSKEIPIIYIQEPNSKFPISIPIPDITPLNPPLGIIPPFPKKFPRLKNTAKLSPLQAVMAGITRAAKTSEAVSASGTLNVLRYGRILKARHLVGVRGAGPAFDGLYYVKSVTHNIKRGEYKQSFTLTRNGLLSTVPVVPP